MKALSRAQCEEFWEQGFLLVEGAVDAALLDDLRRDFDGWIEESRGHDKAYGEMVDGRPRFDLESGHSTERPALRRVNAPIEVSDAFYRSTVDSRQTDLVADLIGPNVKLHHTKINSKLPGARTEVKWHQDFPFTPHSNDALVTALLMVDEVTDENGPLRVVPGSHRGPLMEIWHDDRFTGAVADDIAAECESKAVTCRGPAGATCLMHTRLLHGSAPNNSSRPRTLSISVYSAEDAVPCCPNPVPTRYEGLLVRGEATGLIRSIAYDIRLPQKPSTASFFDQQAEHAKTAG